MRKSVLASAVLLLSVSSVLGADVEQPDSVEKVAESIESVEAPVSAETVSGDAGDFARGENTLDVDMHPELSDNIVLQISYRICMAFIALLRLYLDVLTKVVERMDNIPDCTSSVRKLYRRLFHSLECKSEMNAYAHTGKFWNVVFAGHAEDFTCVGEDKWNEIEKALDVVFKENNDFENQTSACVEVAYDDKWSAIVKMQITGEEVYDDIWDVPCPAKPEAYVYTEEDGSWAKKGANLL